ncbi:MAG TPA: hypothetical protein PLQ59_04075 [Fervidobacterium sp.]|nr:hypothetical protein [Fervidobacterium sp.]
MREYGKAFVYVALVILLGLVGFFIPSVPTKILIVFVSLILTGYFFKFYTSKMVGFVLISIFLFLVPVSSIQLVGGFLHGSTPFVNMPSYFNYWGSTLNDLSDVEKNKYEADTSMKSGQKIIIDVSGGVEVHFVSGDEIAYYHGLDAKMNGSTVTISGGKKNASYVIEIGTEPLEVLRITSVAAKVLGDATISELDISSTAISVDCSLDSDYIILNGTGIAMDGTVKSRNVEIDGTGISFTADGEIEELVIEGTGISMDTTLTNCSNVNINATGVDGTLEYLGGSDLYVEVDGTGGNLTVRNRSGNDVFINSSGVKVHREDAGSNG